MNKTDREIERKFRVTGGGSKFLHAETLKEIFLGELKELPISGTQTDGYFKPFPRADGDFIRLRNDGSRVELTMKKKDGPDNQDRLEYNHDPIGVVEGSYLVFPLKDGTHVSLIKFTNHEPDALFMEVESDSLDVVNAYVSRIEKRIAITEEKRSVFEMYIEPLLAK